MKNTIGSFLKFLGIKYAVDNADVKSSEPEKPWSKSAYQFLVKYIRGRKEFMVEDVRLASEGIVKEPPSKRAWGGIVLRAKNNGLISHKGYRQVKNPKAHRANASVWEVNV